MVRAFIPAILLLLIALPALSLVEKSWGTGAETWEFGWEDGYEGGGAAPPVDNSVAWTDAFARTAGLPADDIKLNCNNEGPGGTCNWVENGFAGSSIEINASEQAVFPGDAGNFFSGEDTDTKSHYSAAQYFGTKGFFSDTFGFRLQGRFSVTYVGNGALFCALNTQCYVPPNAVYLYLGEITGGLTVRF